MTTAIEFGQAELATIPEKEARALATYTLSVVNRLGSPDAFELDGDTQALTEMLAPELVPSINEGDGLVFSGEENDFIYDINLRLPSPQRRIAKLPVLACVSYKLITPTHVQHTGSKGSFRTFASTVTQAGLTIFAPPETDMTAATPTYAVKCAAWAVRRIAQEGLPEGVTWRSL